MTQRDPLICLGHTIIIAQFGATYCVLFIPSTFTHELIQSKQQPYEVDSVIVCMYAKLLSCFRLFATLWTVTYQTPLSMGFSRQEYWNGLPCPSTGDLPNPGTEHSSLSLQADSLPSEPPGKPLREV